MEPLVFNATDNDPGEIQTHHISDTYFMVPALEDIKLLGAATLKGLTIQIFTYLLRFQ